MSRYVNKTLEEEKLMSKRITEITELVQEADSGSDLDELFAELDHLMWELYGDRKVTA